MYCPNFYKKINLKKPISKLAAVLLTLQVLVACQCSAQEEQKASTEKEQKSQRNTQEERMAARRNFLQKERKSIASYINDRNLEMERTGTGLHYEMLQDSAAALSIAEKDIVTYTYKIFNLRGNLLYSSQAGGAEKLKIDRQDAVLGLHEALKLMGLGDSARFILPSHLAYGVAGDQNKVPPMTALVYELKVLNIEKSKAKQ